MHGTGPHALLGGPLLQLHEHDVRLRLDQPPDQPCIQSRPTLPLRHPLVAPAPMPLSGDLQHPAVAHLEPLGHLPKCPLAGVIGRQHLAPKIVTIHSGHPPSFSQIPQA